MLSQSKTKTYKDILVVGAGPIGDCLVLKLKDLGLDPIQVEERKLRTRPGRLNIDIFEMISKYVNRDINPSSGQHIKDIERELEKIVEEKKVNRIEGRYVNLVKDGAEVRLSSGEIKVIPCDLIIDATGSKRSVLSTINEIYEKKKEKPPFQFEDVGKNPVRKHFIAYVGMEKKYSDELRKKQVGLDDTLSDDKNLKNENLKKQLVGICKLRKQFGWEHFSSPQLLVYPLEKNKVCMYVEMPEKLESKDYERWVKAVLKFATNEDIPFTHLKISEKYKLNPKPRFITIDVQPKETTPCYLVSDDGPTIIPVGDALIDPDYRFNIGMKEGIKHIDALLKCFEIRDKMIKKFYFARYDMLVSFVMLDQRAYLRSLYAERSKNLEVDYNVLIQEYLEIASKLDKNIVFQEIVKDLSLPGREDFAVKISSKFYEKAIFEYKNNVLHEDFIDVKKIRWQETLDECYTYLSNALTVLPENKNENREKILLLMKELALKTKDLAEKFVKGDEHIPQNFEMAKKYYQFTLKIYDENVKGDKEYLILCSNLIIVSRKLNDIDSMIEYADMALDKVKLIKTMPEVEKVYVKIIYNKIYALLNKAEKLKEKDHDVAIFSEIDSLMKQLTSKEYKNLAEEMKAIPLRRKELKQYNALVDRVQPSTQEASKPSPFK